MGSAFPKATPAEAQDIWVVWLMSVDCHRGGVYVLHTQLGYLVCGWGSRNGLVHNLLMHFFTPSTSKIEVSETRSFYILATKNDYPSYVKHVLARIYVFFILFWVTSSAR